MKLIFVYNANSGSINSVFSAIHKLVNPASYDCNLCNITFGVFSERRNWKRFKEASNLAMTFLHKDEFLKQYQSKWLPKYSFPIILSEENDELHTFITTETLQKMHNASDLISEIQKRSQTQSH